MNALHHWLRRAHRREEGNFIIIGVFCLIFIAMLFVIIQDAVRKNSYEEALQKLADDAALYGAACVPSISVASYIQSTGVLRPWMQDQNYAVGYHVLSAQDATYIDQFAAAAVRDYVKKNAMNNQTSNYFGGNLEVTRVSPKFVARQEGNREIIEYYVDVELTSKWGSAVLVQSDNLAANAIAKAVIEYESVYTTSSGASVRTANPIFDMGMYARDYIKINNVPGGLDITGNVHANFSRVDIAASGVIHGNVTTGPSGYYPDITGGVTVDGRVAGPDADITWSMPLDPQIDPDIYPQPIKVINGDYTLSGIFPPASWGAQYANGGTLFVKSGSLFVDGETTGSDPVIQGDWCFFVDSNIHFNGINASITQSDNDIAFITTGNVHLNRLRGPAVIHGTVMSNGYFHANNIKDAAFPFTIEGGMYMADYIHLNNIAVGFKLIAHPMPNALPTTMVTFASGTSSPPQYSTPRVTLIH